MYNPPRFQCHDEEAILNLIHTYPLATVISPTHISHLPLIVEKREGRLFLLGHLAKANPHWQNLQDVRVIFHGPNAYISPRWYAANDVPTWAYAVVHLTGQVRVFEGHEDIVEKLTKLSAQMDSGWEFWIPSDEQGRLTQ